MALGELDVEVGDESLHVVVPLDLQVEGRGEGDVLLRAGLDVDLLDQAGVGHHLHEKELGKETPAATPWRMTVGRGRGLGLLPESHTTQGGFVLEETAKEEHCYKTTFL